MDNKALQHLENQYCSQYSQHFYRSSQVLHIFTAHFAIIGLDVFSVTGFSMAGYYNLEAEKENKLCRENASNLDQELIIIVTTYLIYK